MRRVDMRYIAVLACICALFLSVPLGYSYTINAGVEGTGGAISPSGNISVPTGGAQTFTITPGNVLVDVKVDGSSIGPVTSYSFPNVTANHSIFATFACPASSVAKLDLDGTTYDNIMQAYQAGASAAASRGQNGFSLNIVGGILPEETLNFDSDVSVVLNGGFDCNFQNKSMMTAIPGSLTISGGKVTPSNLTISSPPSCQPGDPNNFPGNLEICDGQDNNCNGLIDEGLSPDADHDGHTAIGSCTGTADDCDDSDPNNFPGNAEICDGKDNNCNGQVDEGIMAPDNDGDGYAAIGSCGAGIKTDCNDNNPSINPGALEIFGDGIDQDCNGKDLTFLANEPCTNCHHGTTWGISQFNTAHSRVRTPNNDPICASCHPGAGIDILPIHYGKTVTMANTNNMKIGEVIRCESCHDYHDEPEYSNYTNIVWGKVSAVGIYNVTCDTCHENRAALHAAAHNNRVILELCSHCHTSDTTNLGSPGTGTLTTQDDINTLHGDCATCHLYKIKTERGPDPETVTKAIADGINGAQIDCLTCHGVNWDIIHSGIPGHYDFINVRSTICGHCHQSAPPIVDAADPLRHQACTTCHNPDYSTKSWAVQSGLHLGDQGDCTTCHNLASSGSDYFLTHQHHYNSNNKFTYDPRVDTSQSMALGCASCHHDYDDANGTSVGLSTFTAILWEHDLDGTKDGSPNTCYTCHNYTGGGSPDPATVQNVITSGNPATCASCHTDKVPNVNHATGGKHELHIGITGVSCDTCHNINNFPYFKSGTDQNGDGKYNLAETDVCNACHQDLNGNPADQSFKDGWNVDGYTLACDSCHAFPPQDGAHPTHFTGPPELVTSVHYGDTRKTQDFSGGAISATNMIGCGNCHPMDAKSHGNGIIGDVELGNAAAPAGSLKARSPNGTFDPATKTCSNVYCHSANGWTTDGAVPMPWPEVTGWSLDIDGLPAPLPDNIITTRVYKQVNWNAGHTLGCTGCHSDPPESSYPDNDGGAGNSHYWVDSYGYDNGHAYDMGYDPISCRTCHYDTVHDPSTTEVDPTTLMVKYNDVALYDKSHHVNGTVDVAFDTNNNFTYNTSTGPVTMDLSTASFDPATKTCSNVQCHLQQTKVTWGLPYRWNDRTECNRCHGNVRSTP